jgi:predicted Zn-dependent protease
MGNLGDAIWGGGAKLASLKFSRDDEYEADAFGLEIAARSGYDPRSGLTLFKKLQIASSGVMASWLSTHPANDKRIVQMEKRITETLPLYLEFSKK